MSDVKNIIIKVIPSKVANEFVKKHHYSGKVVNNSNLHFGAFLNNILHGVMSFGSPLDKSKVIGLVHTKENKPCLWNEMLELNRMAFDEYLPKYSESRCIAITIKLIKKNAPHIKWILSFSDGCQSGDGTIYRATGFVLTKIKENNTIWELPDKSKITDIQWKNTKTQKGIISRVTMIKGANSINSNGGASMKPLINIGAKKLEGFQLRYIYLIDKTCKITVPILPFSKIDEAGAGMYKGKKISVKERKLKSVISIVNDAVTNPSEEGGAVPTITHHE